MNKQFIEDALQGMPPYLDNGVVVLSTYSHLLPDEKDQITEFIGNEFKE